MSVPLFARSMLGAAALWAAAALAFELWRSRGAARREVAEPKGSALAGAAYGFTCAMSPTRKESASRHPFAFGAGILLHLGVAASASTVILSWLGTGDSRSLAPMLAGISAVGLVAGAGLFARRLATAELRELSSPDDYLANLAIASLLASTLAFHLGALTAAALQILAAGILLYLPLGKLRHCLFFFLARGDLSARLGSRGVYPVATGGGGASGRRS